MARPRKNVVKNQNSLLTSDNVVEIPVEEQPYPLPEGWKWVRLYNLCSLRNGKAFKPSDWSDSGLPIIRIQNLNNPDSKFNYYSGYIEDKFLISSGDVLFAWSGTPGTSFGAHIWYGGKAVLNQHIFRIDFKGKVILKSFFRYSINCRLEELIAKAHGGAGLQHVTKGVFENTPIPLPTIDEQQRIVDRIESLFAKLDEAREKAEAVLDGFESRKAAILHKAFTGELTAKWRTLKNISLDSWVSCPLISVLKVKPRNGYSPKPVDYKTSIKSMTLSATTSGFFRSEFFKYIDEEIPDDSHLWLSYGDILIQRANSIEKVGTSAIYTGCEHEFIYPDLMMKLRVKSSYSYRYIAYILSTHTVLGYFRANATGIAGNMPKINQQTVSNTPIVVPSYDEQNEIVRILNDLLEKERQVKEAAEDVLERIDLMKKSILAKAFRGELTR